MSVTSGPKISKKGLIFYYDMNNTKKSLLGAPTTNLFGNNLSATNSSRLIAEGKFTGNYRGWETTGVTNDNPRTILYNGSIGVSANTFYTISCLYWSSNNAVDDVYLKFSDTGWTESTYYIQPFTSQSVTRNGSFSITDLGNGWKYCVGTFQTLATTTTLEQLFFDNDNAGVVVFITNIQLELGSIVTPYSSGTRSNTQTIIDLTRRNIITANSLIYSADGTFSFDGSANYISVPMTNIRPALITQECVFKLNTTSGDQVLIGAQYGNLSSNSYALWVNGNNWLGGINIGGTFYNLNTTSGTKQTGKWYHFVHTFNGVQNRLYVNGTSISSQDFGGNFTISYDTNNTLLAIGGDWNSGYNSGMSARTNGTIALVKIYDYALSGQEVLENYNSLTGIYQF